MGGPPGAAKVTHGICLTCYTKEMREVRKPHPVWDIWQDTGGEG